MRMEIDAGQFYNINGLFNDRQEAMSVIDHLKTADFNVEDTKIVEGEGIRDVVREHRLALTRSGALMGATVGALFAVMVIVAMGLLASVSAGQDGVRMMAVVIFFSILLCAGFGAYYATFHKTLNRESVVLGIRVPRDRVSLAESILRAGGARFLALKR
ncbi:MAG: hypothetical protein JST93_36880 [Acidobacteria bacterium]|nr:hypothetical protein [Acidobacteriota bacterium]